MKFSGTISGFFEITQQGVNFIDNNGYQGEEDKLLLEKQRNEEIAKKNEIEQAKQEKDESRKNITFYVICFISF